MNNMNMIMLYKYFLSQWLEDFQPFLQVPWSTKPPLVLLRGLQRKFTKILQV